MSDEHEAALGQLFGARVATLVPNVIDEAAATAARLRLERAGYTRYALIDRGRYEVRDAIDQLPEEAALLARLVAAAEKATGRALRLLGARALRLSAGDYLLTHHDPGHDADEASDRDAGVVELMLDLSPDAASSPAAAAPPGAEAYYRRHGRPFFAVPCQPRALSIVERDAGVRVNHGYLSKRFPNAQVVRLVVRLGPIP